MASLGFRKKLLVGAVEGGSSSLGGVSVSASGTSVGSVLTATLDTGLEVTGYQWTRDGVNINGATSATYTLVSGDVGKSIAVKVSGISIKGSAILVPSAAAFKFSSLAALGDSFTFGVGASTTGQQYITIASLALTGAAPLNKAVSGSVLQNSPDAGGSARPNNVRDIFMSSTNGILGANKRDAAVIASGFNDGRYTGNAGQFNVTAYEADYREVLNGLIEAGDYQASKLILLSPFYITDNGLTLGSAGFTGQTREGFEAFRTAVMNVARDYGTAFYDAYTASKDAVLGGQSLVGPDGYHFNDAGHTFLGQGVIAAADNIINTKAKPGLTASAGTLSIGYTLTAPSSGTVLNYTVERGIVGSYSYGGTATVTTLTGNTFTVSAGTYRVRARANFNDGTSSPWVFSNSVVAAAAGDTTAPAFVSAAIPSGSPNKIVLTYNEPLSSTVTGTPTGLGGKTFSSATVVGSTVEITVSSNYASTDVVTITTASGFVTDVAGNPAAALTAQAVTNNVPAAGGGGGTATAVTFAERSAALTDGPGTEVYSASTGTGYSGIGLVTGTLAEGIDGWIEAQYPDNTTAGAVLTFDPVGGLTSYDTNDYMAHFVPAGTVLQGQNVGATVAVSPAVTLTPSATTRMRLRRNASGVVTIETTTNDGSVWTVRHTFTGTSTGVLYARAYTTTARRLNQVRQSGIA
jgi:lysophospholipase L1-like esterase